MYPAHTQLVAKWSSPSIGDQRATGCEGYILKSMIYRLNLNLDDDIILKGGVQMALAGSDLP